jgi:hypothetical protein
MHPNPWSAPAVARAALDRVMNSLSVFTLAMTIPQVVSVWSGDQRGGGVSLWTWAAYLLSFVSTTSRFICRASVGSRSTGSSSRASC